MTQTDAGTGEQVKEKAGEMAGQAQEKAQQAAGQAREQVRGQIDQRSTDAGERIRAQGSDIRSVGDQLRQQGKDGPAKLADQAAHHVERAGGWLADSDADKILHDVEDAARKNPLAVMLGGLAVGIAASRFLKASSSERFARRGFTASASGPTGIYPGAQLSPPATGATGAGLDPVSPGAATTPVPDGDRFARSGVSGL